MPRDFTRLGFTPERSGLLEKYAGLEEALNDGPRGEGGDEAALITPDNMTFAEAKKIDRWCRVVNTDIGFAQNGARRVIAKRERDNKEAFASDPANADDGS